MLKQIWSKSFTALVTNHGEPCYLWLPINSHSTEISHLWKRPFRCVTIERAVFQKKKSISDHASVLCCYGNRQSVDIESILEHGFIGTFTTIFDPEEG